MDTGIVRYGLKLNRYTNFVHKFEYLEIKMTLPAYSTLKMLAICDKISNVTQMPNLGIIAIYFLHSIFAISQSIFAIFAIDFLPIFAIMPKTEKIHNFRH